MQTKREKRERGRCRRVCPIPRRGQPKAVNQKGRKGGDGTRVKVAQKWVRARWRTGIKILGGISGFKVSPRNRKRHTLPMK